MAVLAHDRDFRGIGKRGFQSVAEPVSHGVAHDHDIYAGRGSGRIGFARCGRFGEILRWGGAIVAPVTVAIAVIPVPETSAVVAAAAPVIEKRKAVVEKLR